MGSAGNTDAGLDLGLSLAWLRGESLAEREMEPISSASRGL